MIAKRDPTDAAACADRAFYTCDKCGGRFMSDRSEQETEYEFQALFGDDPTTTPEERVNPKARGVLCEDCWNAFVAWMRRSVGGR
jgi:hypothetical protein